MTCEKEQLLCVNCGEDCTNQHFMCDRAEGQWCPECFGDTPCGKGDHGEGCPTGVLTVEDAALAAPPSMKPQGDPEFQQPEYLGDAVYVGHDGYHFRLRLNSHTNTFGQIALEPSVLQSLVNYARRLGRNIK